MHKRGDRVRATGKRATRFVTVALFTLLGVAARSARADVVSCTTWHASGQREAKAGRLRAASELFASCGATDACPNEIREECVELYRAVEKSIPTVIFTASDEQGNDLTDVRVYSQGQLLTASLDGRAVMFDPGKYQFKFVFPGGGAFVNDVLVREGEKNRVVAVRLRRGNLAVSGPTTAPDPGAVSPVPSASGSGGIGLPPAFWVSAGVGVAGLASWGVFALLGHNQQSKLDECAPNCGSSRHDEFDAMRRDYLIADLSLGVAVVSAGVATWLLVSNQYSGSSPERSISSASSSRWSVTPLVSPRGGGLAIRADAF